jgi:hypothetical protein
MAKKPTPSAKKRTPVRRSPVPKKKAGSTPVRNTAVPKGKTKSAAAPKAEPTYDQISARAYEIWQSGQGGNDHENWVRAERELRGL